MARTERRQQDALISLIAMRERNADAMRGLEIDRVRLVTHGGLIQSPLWRRRVPVAMTPEAALIADITDIRRPELDDFKV